jgi:2-polyprenyl-3-methyl-5-hydroxy-6-metoxy-1,4-benzoquinol methylase
VFATYLEKGALESCERLNIPSGIRLLDVGCGAGQLTLPAARKGIQVTGLDLAANLVQQAQTKAAEEGLTIEIDEG